MQNNSANILKNTLILGDVLVLNVSFAIGYLIKFKGLANLASDKYLVLFLVFNLAWLGVTYFLKVYSEARVLDFDNYAFKIIRICIVHTLLITAFWVLRKAFYYSREQLFWSFALLYPLMFVWRGLFFYFVKRHRKSGKNFKSVVVVGAGELAEQLVQIFQRNVDYGYKVQAIFADVEKEYHGSLTIAGHMDELMAFVKENKVDEMYCSAADVSPQNVKTLNELADNNLIRFRLLPDVRGVGFTRLNMDFYEHLPVLSPRKLPLDDAAKRFVKRAFDIAFSLLVLVLVMSWLFPLLAILIKLTSKGPVIFRQKRSGIDNREFYCYKFRSMTMNTDADSKQASRGDARITPLGRILRKTSLDEFPQFLNVLIGNMSVVGPRPHMVKHTEQYSKVINKYMVRHFVKPGITGLAQVKGFRGETKDPRQMEGRIRLDKLYVESWSLILDLWIILRTIINVFFKTKDVH